MSKNTADNPKPETDNPHVVSRQSLTGNREPPTAEPDEPSPPPFLRSWRSVYSVVLAFLALLILLMYVFMRSFS